MTVEHVTLDSRVGLREADRQKIADDTARFLAAGREVTVVASDAYDHEAKHLTVSDHAKNGWENRGKPPTLRQQRGRRDGSQADPGR